MFSKYQPILYFKEFLLNAEKYQQKSLFTKTENTDCVKSSIDNQELDDMENIILYSKNQIDRMDFFGIEISNASAKWIQSQPDRTLNNINLTVTPGQLVAIIGPVGAGKVFTNCKTKLLTNIIK